MLDFVSLPARANVNELLRGTPYSHLLPTTVVVIITFNTVRQNVADEHTKKRETKRVGEDTSEEELHR